MHQKNVKQAEKKEVMQQSGQVEPQHGFPALENIKFIALPGLERDSCEHRLEWKTLKTFHDLIRRTGAGVLDI